MNKKVVAKSAIPILAREIHEEVERLSDEISLQEVEPFVKIFLQYKSEYDLNQSTFIAYPNNTFLAGVVVDVLAEEEAIYSQVLLEELSLLVADHAQSDFSSFGYRDLPTLERKVLFLKEHLFSEMLEDFNRDLTREMPDYGEEGSQEEVVREPIDLPDDLLEESIPELQQGIVRVQDK